MERPRTILVSPVTALTELNAGGNIRPCSETTAKTVPTRFQFGRASTLEQLCKAAPPQDTKLGCRSSLKKLTNLTQLFCVPSNHGSNREAESTDAPERGGLPRSILKRGNARGAKGVGHRL
jgi:hypothetical protein